MTTARYLIQELITNPYKLIWQDDYEARFTTKDDLLYTVEFVVNSDIPTRLMLYFFPTRRGNLNLYQTASHDSFRIFATVMTALNIVLSRDSEFEVVFSGAYKAQDKLYKKALDKFSSRMSLDYTKRNGFFYVRKK